MKRVNIHDVRHQFHDELSIPHWGKRYRLLIRTRRRNRYYIVDGIAYGTKWSVQGFRKFKVIGRHEPETVETTIRSIRVV